MPKISSNILFHWIIYKAVQNKLKMFCLCNKAWSKEYLIKLSLYMKGSKLSRMSDIDIVIVGNKFDLLPCTGPLFEQSIKECLLHQCAEKDISGEQIKYVELISAKTGFHVERLITKLFNIWNDEGNVYLLGMANAGKSVLFNQLLGSDYCRCLASDAIVRATTSFWPGTTLNMLSFPINFLSDHKKGILIIVSITSYSLYMCSLMSI